MICVNNYGNGVKHGDDKVEKKQQKIFLDRYRPEPDWLLGTAQSAAAAGVEEEEAAGVDKEVVVRESTKKFCSKILQPPK